MRTKSKDIQPLYTLLLNHIYVFACKFPDKEYITEKNLWSEFKKLCAFGVKSSLFDIAVNRLVKNKILERVGAASRSQKLFRICRKRLRELKIEDGTVIAYHAGMYSNTLYLCNLRIKEE